MHSLAFCVYTFALAGKFFDWSSHQERREDWRVARVVLLHSTVPKYIYAQNGKF